MAQANISLGFSEVSVAAESGTGSDAHACADVLVVEGQEFRQAARGPDPQLYFDGGVVTKKVAGIFAKVLWADQGWGNRKGCIWMRIVRGGAMVHEELLFGVAPHHMELELKVFGRDLAAQIRIGDSINFWRLIGGGGGHALHIRSEEHTSELQSLMRISYAVFCLKTN